MAGCLPQQAGAKLFETQSALGSQITLPSLVSPPPSAPRVAKREREEEERGRWLVIRQQSQLALDQHPPSPAGTCWGSARCSALQKKRNYTTSQGAASCGGSRRVSLRGSEKLTSLATQFDSIRTSHDEDGKYHRHCLFPGTRKAKYVLSHLKGQTGYNGGRR